MGIYNIGMFDLLRWIEKHCLFYYANTDRVEYITINSPGNGNSFGTLLTGAAYHPDGSSNATNERALNAGAQYGGSSTDIHYFTVNSASDSTDFGDLFENLTGSAASCGSGVNDRCLWWSEISNTIQYRTISSTGNAADFGNLTATGVSEGGTADAGGC